MPLQFIQSFPKPGSPHRHLPFRPNTTPGIYPFSAKQSLRRTRIEFLSPLGSPSGILPPPWCSVLVRILWCWMSTQVRETTWTFKLLLWTTPTLGHHFIHMTFSIAEGILTSSFLSSYRHKHTCIVSVVCSDVT